jgi:hypothetical protein
MPLGQLVIMIAVISTSFGIWVYFFLKNKQIHQLHVQRVLDLSEEFAGNKLQILIRKKGLDRYNFLNYNLSESLVIQPEINI